MFHDGPVPSSPLWSPRIEKNWYTAIMFLLFGIAILAAGARTAIRVLRFKKITVDDIFLLFACIFFAVSIVVTHKARDFMYRAIYQMVGIQIAPPFDTTGTQYAIVTNVITVCVWASIYCVKISFMLFLKQLIPHVHNTRTWWWIVFIVICCAAPVGMFMGFYICSDFSENPYLKCPQESIVANTKIYLLTSCFVDVGTDLLLLSVPIALVYKVQLTLKRKLAVLTVLCLSIFMIIIAIIRVSMFWISPLSFARSQDKQPDTIWLFFWQNVEAATAIIMVSITAFRSMLGQSRNANSKNFAALAVTSIGGREPLCKQDMVTVRRVESAGSSYDEMIDMEIGRALAD